MAEPSPLSMIEDELNHSIGNLLPNSKFLAGFLVALVGVCRVTLYQIANAFPGKAKPESHLKRIGRFLDDFWVTPDAFARAIAVLLPVPRPWTLAVDRTEWHLGNFHFNLLVLAVVHEKMAFPLLWMPLGPGPSDTGERILLLSRFLTLFGKGAVAFVTADREFIGRDWLCWLTQERLSFGIRIRTTDLLENGRGEFVEAATLFARRHRCRRRPFRLWGVPVYAGGRPLKEGDTLIVVSDVFGELLHDYSCRWGIETLFQAMKGRGFEMEATHVTHPQRLSRLRGLLALGFLWCYKNGLALFEEKPVELKKHGRAAKSMFRAGKDFLRRLLLPLCGHFRVPDFQKAVQALRAATSAAPV